MSATVYSKRLGAIAPHQFQAALDRFELGRLVSAEPIPFGLFGQNVKVTSSAGEFVLRGAAHVEWQFPKERLVASLVHEQTSVPVPWPYLVDLDESIFGWRHGYALMSYLPGVQLADQTSVAELTEDDRRAIAFVLGQTLHELHRVESPFSGDYDHIKGGFRPFKDELPSRIVKRIRDSIDRSSARGEVAFSDRQWIEARIAEAREELAVPFTPVLVHHDYKHGNLAVRRDAGQWNVSGVFDLMEAFFGDGELDLVREIGRYLDTGEDSLAGCFLDGFRTLSPLRTGGAQRVAVYLIRDRVGIWEFLHRPEFASWWSYGEIGLREWLENYLSALARLI